MSIAKASEAIAATTRRARLSRRAVMRAADELLEKVEQENLHPTETTPGRLPEDLAAAINELLGLVGLAARELRTTAAGLDAIYDTQAAITGSREGDE